MSDMTASAASQMETMSARAATTGVKHGMRASVVLSSGGARVSVRVANRTAGGTIRALVAIIEAARFAGLKNGESGRVGLKQFTKITNGKREILPITEKEVVREFSRELRKHGVTFAIERHRDGSRTFHVEGKDATVIEHALAQASDRVDARIQREAERRAQTVADETKEPEQDETTQAQDDDPFETLVEDKDLSLAEQGARDLPDTADLPNPEIVLQLDRREEATLVQALHGAPHREALAEQIQNEAQVVLNRENVAILNTVAGEQGWTTEGEMGWVARAVEHEHSQFIDEPTVDNPWLTVEAETARTPDGAALAASNPFAPGELDGHVDQQAVAPTVEPSAAAPQQGEPRETGGREAPAASERQLSPRDATREKVSKQIDTKVHAIKAERGVGQTKNRATPRSPKVKR